MKVSSDGMIIGGDCDHEHQNRKQRELGARVYVNYLIDRKIVKVNEGGKWIEIKKKTTRTFPSPLELKRQGLFNQTHDELGAWRSFDVFEELMGKKISKIGVKKFYNMINKVNAPVSNVEYVFELMFNTKKRQPIMSDHIYKKRKKLGEFC